MYKESHGDLMLPSNPAENVYLELVVSDFGPISKGQIVLKPLTVFVGPNNSGKSHMATLVHSIMTVESELHTFVLNDTASATHGDIFLRNEALRIYQEHVINGCDSISSSIYDTMAAHAYQIFPEILTHNFSTPINNLIRAGKEFMSMDIDTARIMLNFDIESTGVSGGSEGSHYELKVEFADHNSTHQKVVESEDSGISHIIVPRNSTANGIYNILKKTLQQQKHITRSIYFPAERGGLTMSHKLIISNYYERVGKSLARLPDPTLTGVATDFLVRLLHMPKHEGPLAHIVRSFETQALGGEVIMRHGLANTSDLYFKQPDIDIPLHKASSSVKDLAVLLLCVKYVIKPQDLLVLEEPEVNLHPTNQILMARLIAQLVNAGVYVLVSTHSEFLLEQLGHCMLAHAMQDKSKSMLPASEILNKDDVAAYRFIQDDGGYITQSILTQDGIRQTEFTDVFDKQYSELLDIRAQQT